MSFEPNGELVPEGGGDNIPLIRKTLTIGRREGCDICLRLPNVSGLHCELSFQDGFWLIKDMGSTNGIKVNGMKVPKKVLNPGEKITIAKKTFTIDYQPPAGMRAKEEMETQEEEDILSKSLLERAGLTKPGAVERLSPGKPDNEYTRKTLNDNGEEEG
jgi:pSer/pThr/pTyr-binding forkhead associated (FHA) protein